MEHVTIRFSGKAGGTETWNGLYAIVPAGVVLIHTKATQTFIPWHRIIDIEQYINTSAFEMQEVERKRLSYRLRSN